MIYLDCVACGGYFGIQIVCGFPPDEEFRVVDVSCKKLDTCLSVFSPEFEEYVWNNYLDGGGDETAVFSDLPDDDENGL